MPAHNLFYDKLDQLKKIGDNIQLSNGFAPQQVKCCLQNYKKSRGKKISFRRLSGGYLLTLVDFV